MKILTKEVLAEFIADSNQIYLAGMLSDKIEGVSLYAEFIRTQMNQKKHKEVHNELFRNRKGSGQRNT